MQHQSRVILICGYLNKYPDGCIRFRIKTPETRLHQPMVEYDWTYTIYGDVKEELPHNMPTPRGKAVRTSDFEDANLMHCLLTGRSTMGALSFVQGTPIDWFCKRQNTVETAVYGSEMVAG